MSSTVSCQILSSARRGFFILQVRRCWYSRYITVQNKAKWKRRFSRTPFTQGLLEYAGTENILPRKTFFRHISTEEDFHFQLAPSHINDILRANEQCYKIQEFDGRNASSVLKFESNQLAANAPNEDRRSAATCLQTKGLLFGIFDGHAGHTCAQSLSERLFYYIAVSLMSQQMLEELEFAMEHMKPVPPVLQWHKHQNDYTYREVASLYVDHLRVYWQELIELDNEVGLSVEDALTYSFKRLDSDISLEGQVPMKNDLVRNLALQVAFSGATACVAHIDNVHLHVANAGDCRAILGVQDKDGTWSSLPLTQDHNSLNEMELLRLRQEHPKSEEQTVVMDNRLLGILMPVRAFGDVRFKWSKELQQSVLENACDVEALNIYQYAPQNYHTPPYLTAEPEIRYHRLRPQDKFLVIASDGLWDMLDNEEVIRLLAEHLSGVNLEVPEPELTNERRSLGYMQNLLLKRRARGVQSYDQNGATHLIRHAVGNNEYGVIEQEKLSAMLSLPDDLARMYRDDITITVVYFNSSNIEMYGKEK
ncbi:pyruvate dehydrogenase [acetyl-transferring]-phosphatase 2, mitochondrial [Microcaecilia unicolor]|uniref:Pyruvate dehydrogenase [acetyl-transferring]-phosphatase 2, mitochondrial n=1 Tax=Microcaecilia unicolor TaxID=1415580 RepID=A0A6P7Y5U8_9AMPH|nr:pyruvate dehydrogenase [acetyl-transferring]-phosphatase 2, mitochondrial [Microcaecilia unicolor]XP_030060327.1 pyruvate dehydrogenase [acetyl-transferring]-phosphatase 2, mitochondrial [Microcaecilia unicolor]XP_030060328.1 pyruvate dehydrogenase [acetyl-transferring]-phosphatase 2, mitochondrial [Microcaecilia unicolor]XP_030060329.1 pyruvate dehydrogenase [acetyl-transferring]-phosphatase 2, mitochondrial [Microcaecilia unicolor]XP_030060330.1 pyruvate dehydrogenase [acetyl-transferring]